MRRLHCPDEAIVASSTGAAVQVSGLAPDVLSELSVAVVEKPEQGRGDAIVDRNRRAERPCSSDGREDVVSGENFERAPGKLRRGRL